jgi:multidrug efflux pump subunit AcrA (membrane-fusion protein)
MHFAMVTLGATLLIVGPAEPQQRGLDLKTERISECLITLKHDVDVASEEAGVLVDIPVEEGQAVAKDDLLAQINDAQVRALRDVAQHRLKAAEAEADNDVNIRHAQAAAKVRETEYLQAQEAERALPGTVSGSEMRRLAYSAVEARLAIEQAERDLNIADITVDVQKAELDAADLDVERRKIKAPRDGVVVKRFEQVGEWVRPGDPLVRVISLDTLYLDGSVDAKRFSPADVEGCLVTGTAPRPRGGEAEFQGRIVFASPEVESGANFAVRAEVENPGHLLRPGEFVDMTIHLDRRVPARTAPERTAPIAPSGT